MTPTTPASTDINIDTDLEALKDNAATQRALDYYLKPSVSSRALKDKLFVVRNGLSQEEAMVHASDLLRCAIASGQESAENLQGNQRDLAFSVVYIMEMAKALVDQALDAHQLPSH